MDAGTAPASPSRVVPKGMTATEANSRFRKQPLLTRPPRLFESFLYTVAKSTN
jgi:hypothetical protein